MCAVGGCLYAIQSTLAEPNLRFFTLLGSITFLLIMVLGGAATLWGPIVGAFAYVILDTRTREAGESGEGVIGWLFGWMTGSPATLILAIVLLIIVFVAPFGIVGLLKRIAAKFIVIIPRPAGTAPRLSPRSRSPRSPDRQFDVSLAAQLDTEGEVHDPTTFTPPSGTGRHLAAPGRLQPRTGGG